MIGSLGPIPFTASADKVRTFDGYSKQAEARFSEHTIIGKKPLLEFTGPGLESISMKIRLDAFLGINPLTEITRLAELRDAGQALPLVIGGKYKGDYVISSLSETHRTHDNQGRLLLADVQIELKEYADDRV